MFGPIAEHHRNKKELVAVNTDSIVLTQLPFDRLKGQHQHFPIQIFCPLHR